MVSPELGLIHAEILTQEIANLIRLTKALLNRRISNSEYRIPKCLLHWHYFCGPIFLVRYSIFQICQSGAFIAPSFTKAAGNKCVSTLVDSPHFFRARAQDYIVGRRRIPWLFPAEAMDLFLQDDRAEP
jgi:hypothetical protein